MLGTDFIFRAKEAYILYSAVRVLPAGYAPAGYKTEGKGQVRLFERYILKHLALATLLVGCALTAVIFLSQSLRFLELVMASGASAASFWLLTALALPRFLEIIVPLALMAATVFVYNRMNLDSEIVALRAAGAGPLALARPALVAAGAVTLALWIVTAWIAPASVAQMQNLRQIVKSQYSALLFREGVFTSPAEGITVFVRAHRGSGALEGIVIHDTRPENRLPVTILARRGAVAVEPDGERIVVYDGSRQEYDPDKRILRKLDFERYTVALPSEAPVGPRRRDADERSLTELLHPDPAEIADPRTRRQFHIEAHKRLAAPLLAPAFVVCALAFLLVGPMDRRGQAGRIALCVASVVVLEALFLVAYNLCRQSDSALPLLYATALGPLAAGLYALRRATYGGGTLRRSAPA